MALHPSQRGTIVASVVIHIRRPSFRIQVFSEVVFDIVLLTLLMHAAGGVRSGFGILLLVAVAGGSILTSGRTAIALAARLLISEGCLRSKKPERKTEAMITARTEGGRRPVMPA